MVQNVPNERIRQSQEEEICNSNLKIYLTGHLSVPNPAESNICALISLDYDVDQERILFLCPRSATTSEGHTELVQLMIAELLQKCFLRH